jgi:hypothetical protein
MLVLEQRGGSRDHLTAKTLQIYIESQASSLPHPVGSTVIYQSPRISANNLDIVIRFLATNGVCGFIVNGTLCRKGCCSPCRETPPKNQTLERVAESNFPPVDRNPDEPLGNNQRSKPGRVE